MFHMIIQLEIIVNDKFEKRGVMNHDNIRKNYRTAG